jgi:SpoVK/Ycf46/Vps4 family AAA+-type ATPase
MQLLDGIDSPENVIFIATTNNYDQLDKALIRPGRFDLSIEIGKMSHDTANRMSEFMVGKSLDQFNPEYLKDDHINSSALFGELLQEKMKILMKQGDNENDRF